MTEQGPIIFDDDAQDLDVDTASHIDVSASAMGIITSRTARKTGWLGRILMSAIGGFLALVITMSFWNFILNLTASNIILGRIALVLFLIILTISALYLLREFIAIWRLGRVDRLRQQTRDAWISESLLDAQKASDGIANMLGKRGNSEWDSGKNELMDARDLLEFTERKLLQILDNDAQIEIQKRARQVAVVTAFIPLALADVIAVLTANIGMIRAIAEIYGGRPGIIGGWRLFQKVATHLVATGAVAVGDDMIGSVLGGGVLSKISRRFGEGVINAALTARVGIATIEVCRPMDFHALSAPSTSGLVSKALAGFAGTQKNGS